MSPKQIDLARFCNGKSPRKVVGGHKSPPSSDVHQKSTGRLGARGLRRVVFRPTLGRQLLAGQHADVRTCDLD